jgi:hypothetical protein
MTLSILKIICCKFRTFVQGSLIRNTIFVDIITNLFWPRSLKVLINKLGISFTNMLLLRSLVKLYLIL